MTTGEPPPYGEHPEPGDDGSRLTARQRELLEELTALDPHLAGLYRQGLRLLQEVETPGTAYLLSHIGRELTLGVVDAVLEEGWSLSERDLSEIPDDEGHREKIARSLDLNPSDRRVSQWFELHRVFVAAVHYRRGGQPPDPRILRVSFERLEQLLYGRVGPYFKTQAELDALLAVAEPDETHVERLQAVLLRPQQRRYFFGKLASASWIRPLDLTGAFRTPPERRVHPDGSWQLVAWPEGEYLARVAEDKPLLVVDILERLQASNKNPAVWRVVADVANRVPTDVAVRLVPQLTKAVGNVLPVIFAGELLTLIARLAEPGHPDAFDLAASLLYVPPSGDIGEVSPYSSRTDWIFPRLQWTQFSEFTERALQSLERTDQERTLALLMQKLGQIAAVARKLDLARLVDPWVASLDEPEPDDVVGQLFEATSQMLVRFAAVGPRNARCALEMLEQHKDEVFRRLRYRVIAAAGGHLRDELDSVLCSTLSVEPGKWGREIAMILRQQYGNASDPARRMFRYSLERGPDPETVTGTLDFREIDVPTPEDIEDIKRTWQKRRLMWFRGAIPDELREIADDLGMWGEKPSIEDQELAEVGFYSGPTAAWGEPRPFTSEDLRERSPEEIAQLIIEWRPGETPFETGTTRGLELSVQEVAAADPLKALATWEAGGEDLPLGFARSLLDGLRDALKGQAEGFDWDRTVSFLRATVDRAIQSADEPMAMRLALLRSASGLLDDSMGNDLVPASLEAEIWSALTAAATHPLAWTEEGEEFRSFGDVLGAALNSTAPAVVYSALQAGLWSYRLRQGQDTREASRVAEEHLSPILDEVLARTGSGRATAEVMIGQLLPQLQLIAPEWFERHGKELLDAGVSEPLKHPAWGAYVLRGRFYDSTFKGLRPWYVAAAEVAFSAFNSANAAGDHWSVTRGLAEHVLLAVLRGLAAVGDPDRLVETTFTNVPVRERTRAYWGIFRSWTDVEEAPSEAFVSRLLAFWEWRLDQLERADSSDEVLEEAQGLGWFLRTPHLPAAEVLRLGVRTAKAAKGNLEVHADWEWIRYLAMADADAAYNLAELLLEGELGKEHHYVSVEDVKALFRISLDRGGPETCRRVRRMVNRLGEAGYEDFRELLD